MIQLRRIWQHANETDIVHLMLVKDDRSRRIRLKRSNNPAMYDFLVEDGGIAVDPGPGPNPEPDE